MNMTISWLDMTFKRNNLYRTYFIDYFIGIIKTINWYMLIFNIVRYINVSNFKAINLKHINIKLLSNLLSKKVNYLSRIIF